MKEIASSYLSRYTDQLHIPLSSVMVFSQLHFSYKSPFCHSTVGDVGPLSKDGRKHIVSEPVCPWDRSSA